MIDFDLSGIGELGEIFTDAQDKAESAVQRMEAGLNSNFSEVGSLARFGGTVTLLGISETDDGVHISPAIGMLLGSPPDPCQRLRNLLRLLRNEIRIARRDGESESRIDAMEADFTARKQDLQRCRETAD